MHKVGLRLKTKLYPGVSQDLLARRRENLAQVQAHVEDMIKVPNDTLASRVHHVFSRPHLSVCCPYSPPQGRACACVRVQAAAARRALPLRVSCLKICHATLVQGSGFRILGGS